MPHFNDLGEQTWICQKCGGIFSIRELPHSREDITGNRSAKNVCSHCVKVHDFAEISRKFERIMFPGVDMDGSPFDPTPTLERLCKEAGYTLDWFTSIQQEVYDKESPVSGSGFEPASII